MPLQVDDMHVGQWIAVIGEASSQHDDNPFSFMRPRCTRVDGRPLKVMAVTPPFVAVDDGISKYALDTRELTFTRLDKRYVNQMSAHGRRAVINENGGVLILDRAPIKKSETKDHRDCPNCGESRLRQVHRAGIWKLVCPVCSFEGGMPTSKQ